ncbi:MAG: hypothetical protein ABIR96_08765 [Bdellovibrionota bacterium]
MTSFTIRLSFLTLALLSAPAFARSDFSGSYSVPVADARLAPHANFDVIVERITDNQTVTNLNVMLPYELVGIDGYTRSFSRVTTDDGSIAFEARYPNEATDSLRCSVAESQKKVICLASWPSLRGRPLDTDTLRARLIVKNPTISAQDLDSKVAVARAFNGDAIGILFYKTEAFFGSLR